MKKTHPLRASLQRLLPSVAVFGKALGLVYSKRSMLRELGYIESSRTKRPCRRDGSPLPWTNYHVIAFLEERLNKNLSLFEYGSGTSTSFYASLVNNVVSVETNPDWYAEVKETVPENVELKFIDAEARKQYCELAAKENRKFDVIIVDDLDRTECVIEAPKALSDSGVVVLDDYHAEIHRPAIDFLKSRGLSRAALCRPEAGQHSGVSNDDFLSGRKLSRDLIVPAASFMNDRSKKAHFGVDSRSATATL